MSIITNTKSPAPPQHKTSTNIYMYIYNMIYIHHLAKERKCWGLEIRAAYSGHIRRQVVHNVIPAAELRGQPHTDATTPPLDYWSEKRYHKSWNSFIPVLLSNHKGSQPMLNHTRNIIFKLQITNQFFNHSPYHEPLCWQLSQEGGGRYLYGHYMKQSEAEWIHTNTTIRQNEQVNRRWRHHKNHSKINSQTYWLPHSIHNHARTCKHYMQI